MKPINDCFTTLTHNGYIFLYLEQRLIGSLSKFGWKVCWLVFDDRVRKKLGLLFQDNEVLSCYHPHNLKKKDIGYNCKIINRYGSLFVSISSNVAGEAGSVSFSLS